MKISRIFLTLRVTASSGFQDNVWCSIFYETLCNMGYDVDFYPYDEAKINADNKRENNISQISENIFTVFAKKHKIKHQLEILTGGGTDTAGIQRFTPGGSIAGAISIPTRHIHQVIEMADKSDIRDAIKLLRCSVMELSQYDWGFK